jgi:hypothetical protein
MIIILKEIVSMTIFHEKKCFSNNTLFAYFLLVVDMKDETDIIASMAASPIGPVFMIMNAETFKTNVIVLSV